jgi:chromosome segregation ATPase
MALDLKNRTLINALQQIRQGTVGEALLTPELQAKLGNLEQNIVNIYDTMSTDSERIAAMSGLTLAFQQADGTLQGALEKLVQAASVKVDAETEARKQAVSTLIQELNDLDQRISGVDRALTEAVRVEASRAQAAEKELQTKVEELIAAEALLDQRLAQGFRDLSTQLATVVESVDQVNTKVDGVTKDLGNLGQIVDSVAKELSDSNVAQNKSIDGLKTDLSKLADELVQGLADNKSASDLADQEQAKLIGALRTDLNTVDRAVAAAQNRAEKGIAEAETALRAAQAAQADATKGISDAQAAQKAADVADRKSNQALDAIAEEARVSREQEAELSARLQAIEVKPTDLVNGDVIGVIDGRSFEFLLPKAVDVSRPFFLQFNGVEIYAGDDFEMDSKDPYKFTTVGSPDPGDKLKVKYYPTA